MQVIPATERIPDGHVRGPDGSNIPVWVLNLDKPHEPQIIAKPKPLSLAMASVTQMLREGVYK